MDPFTWSVIVGAILGLGYLRHQSQRNRIEELERKLKTAKTAYFCGLLFLFIQAIIVIVLVWLGYLHLPGKRREEPVSIVWKILEFTINYNRQNDVYTTSYWSLETAIAIGLIVTTMIVLMLMVYVIGFSFMLSKQRNESTWQRIFSIQFLTFHYENHQQTCCGFIANGLCNMLTIILLIVVGLFFWYLYKPNY